MKREFNFEIGDLVEVIGVESRWENGVGKIGTVVWKYSNTSFELYGVEFPNSLDNPEFHDCMGHAKKHHGWNIRGCHLTHAAPGDLCIDQLL